MDWSRVLRLPPDTDPTALPALFWGAPEPWQALAWGGRTLGWWFEAIRSGDYLEGPPLSPGRLQPHLSHRDPAVRAWAFLELGAAPADADAFMPTKIDKEAETAAFRRRRLMECDDSGMQMEEELSRSYDD